MAEATCETPRAATASPAPGIEPRGGPTGPDAAATGGDAATPYLAAGAVALLAAGAVAAAKARRRR
ncbi:LAETG motif-containing sortase-dependent surface protein [Streptomyces glaucescens]|uniref:LAETG motif-containing sortase-dependent surface protein n=1 Tax=Streptomyces glaucescens TaxID=1907 RepID=UPI000D1A2926|nr:LAETG motif-containing sortase-dependent surface protein [Streptomyces glaucescens]